MNQSAPMQPVFKDPPLPANSYEEWLQSEEAKKFAGMNIAFVPGHGVIAAAPKLADLMKLVREHERGKEASIDLVPRA